MIDRDGAGLTDEERQVLLAMPREELTDLIEMIVADVSAQGFEPERARQFVLDQLGLATVDA